MAGVQLVEFLGGEGGSTLVTVPDPSLQATSDDLGLRPRTDTPPEI